MSSRAVLSQSLELAPVWLERRGGALGAAGIAADVRIDGAVVRTVTVLSDNILGRTRAARP